MTVTRRGYKAGLQGAAGKRPARSIGTGRPFCYRTSTKKPWRNGDEWRMNSGRTIGIAGAGSIGCFVGGMLAAGSRRVALLARPRVIGEIEANGLRLTSFEGSDQTVAASRFALSENPSIFGDAG